MTASIKGKGKKTQTEERLIPWLDLTRNCNHVGISLVGLSGRLNMSSGPVVWIPCAKLSWDNHEDIIKGYFPPVKKAPSRTNWQSALSNCKMKPWLWAMSSAVVRPGEVNTGPERVAEMASHLNKCDGCTGRSVSWCFYSNMEDERRLNRKSSNAVRENQFSVTCHSGFRRMSFMR